MQPYTALAVMVRSFVFGRWRLYYGVKALALESAEAAIFWHLLNETNGEDYLTFLVYCLAIVEVRLWGGKGGGGMWGYVAPSRRRCDYSFNVGFVHIFCLVRSMFASLQLFDHLRLKLDARSLILDARCSIPDTRCLIAEVLSCPARLLRQKKKALPTRIPLDIEGCSRLPA